MVRVAWVVLQACEQPLAEYDVMWQPGELEGVRDDSLPPEDRTREAQWSASMSSHERPLKGSSGPTPRPKAGLGWCW